MRMERRKNSNAKREAVCSKTNAEGELGGRGGGTRTSLECRKSILGGLIPKLKSTDEELSTYADNNSGNRNKKHTRGEYLENTRLRRKVKKPSNNNEKEWSAEHRRGPWFIEAHYLLKLYKCAIVDAVIRLDQPKVVV